MEESQSVASTCTVNSKIDGHYAKIIQLSYANSN